MASDLQKRFACAAHANPLPGAKANGACEVVMQGDVATRVGTYLCEQWGVPKNCIPKISITYILNKGNATEEQPGTLALPLEQCNVGKVSEIG